MIEKSNSPQPINPNDGVAVLSVWSEKVSEVAQERPDQAGRQLETTVLTHAARLVLDPNNDEVLQDWKSAHDALEAYDAVKSAPLHDGEES